MDVIHYGPVFMPRRKLGTTLALCIPKGASNTMSTSKDMVTCPKCIQQLKDAGSLPKDTPCAT